MTHKYWHGTLLYVKTVTVDGRALEHVEVPYIRMPLPLLDLTPQPHPVGSIDAVWQDGTRFEACGSYFGPGQPGDVFRVGADVRLGDAPWMKSLFTGVMTHPGGVLLGATICHTPDWPDATITILEEPYVK